jgi:hypothetical protein
MTETQIKTNRDDQVTEAMLAFGMRASTEPSTASATRP